MPESAVFGIAFVVVLGVSAQWAAWRLNLPSILLLLVFGFVVGPLSGRVFGSTWLDPDHLFGPALFPLVSLSVGLILYEGGLTLKLRELREVGTVVRNLCLLGALLTWLPAALAAWLLFDIRIDLALLIGAVVVVTGPTVIGPMLRHIRPAGAVGSILKWEGIVIDPIGALLSVLVFEAVLLGGSEGASASHVLVAIAKTIVFGGGLGVAAGYLLALLIGRYWIPDFLQNAVSLMLVVATFAITNQFQEEAGLLAVTVMGFVLANQRLADVEHIVEFKENLRVLLISLLFILLASRLDIDDLLAVGWAGAGFVLVLVLLVRPLAVFGSTIGARLTFRERLFLSWMAPRGIVAAAVSSLFAIQLVEHAVPNAEMLSSLVFVTIIGTVTIYGLTAPLVARQLGVAEANPQGFLLVGAHDWARALAQALKAQNVRVALIDNNWNNIAAARLEGLTATHGSVLAEQTLEKLEMGGLGRMLAVTPNDWVNVLAVRRFTALFGSAACYQMPLTETERTRGTHRHLHGRLLFDQNVSYLGFEARMRGGFSIKATKLTEEFSLDDFRARYGGRAIPLFWRGDGGRLHVVSVTGSGPPQTGITLVSLVPPRAEVDPTSPPADTGKE